MAPVVNEQDGKGAWHRGLPGTLLVHVGIQLISLHRFWQPGDKLRALNSEVFDVLQVVAATARRHGSVDVAFLLQIGRVCCTIR
ncbi:hypothetical protein MFORT_22260 [Mycolicibacterium fortuitum subsp. fortuitum DSM 46621 = ATCC 6841 = JCM 6387]|uniref:Uncharacterized protein n=1 Tax=Mycolicibacterium fortuitum subsp. fortuitum DSM 46621 = ATCC 6841 = JCM 6387 TaxID=1214102 RepID=K0URQ3_MYCFO|nr:hypothetical protein MFORT_22260 [Mycolicibacterium fortuitum subsp. fortuitum DSM 46621 = ATCC 6841 = JCM 6387]